MEDVFELIPVDLKEVWAHEAHDFTPWLAANPDRLERVLGMELELEGTEVAVGPFAADIVFQEASTGKRVVVENMLGATDHDHLGKVLTYAAGLDASYCVLVARDIRPEHRPTLDWLNYAADEIGFFGVEVSAVRIGDSSPAAQLTVVAQPDGWVRQTPKAGLTATQRNYIGYWTTFLEVFNEQHPTWGNVRKAPPQNWINVPSGIPGVPFYLTFAWPTGSPGHVLSAGLYVSPPGDGAPDRLFDYLSECQEEIEARFGSSLTWERLEENISRRIYVSSHVVDPMDNDGWGDYTAWMIENVSRLRDAIAPALESMPAL